MSVAGNYISMNVKDGDLLDTPEMLVGIQVPRDEYHVTLMYSVNSSLNPDRVLWLMEHGFPDVVVAKAIGYDCFDDEEGSALVLKLQSVPLEHCHLKLRSLGMEHSYPEFSPHITVAYRVPTDLAYGMKKLLNDTHKPFYVTLQGYNSEVIDEDYENSL